VIIPHGIFDLLRNRGHINIGLSRDTTQFACDSLRWYWNRIGWKCYPDADSMLLLCDCGGSNSASKYIFKHDLQAVANSNNLCWVDDLISKCGSGASPCVKVGRF